MSARILVLCLLSLSLMGCSGSQSAANRKDDPALAGDAADERNVQSTPPQSMQTTKGALAGQPARSADSGLPLDASARRHPLEVSDAAVWVAVAPVQPIPDAAVTMPMSMSMPDAGRVTQPQDAALPMPDAGKVSEPQDAALPMPDAGKVMRPQDGATPPPQTGQETRPPDASAARDEDAGVTAQLCPIRVASIVSEPATTWLVIDASGSMVIRLGDVSRWQALHDTLFGPDNIVEPLQGQLQWGMILFDGRTANGASTIPCPRTQIVDPGLNNFSALSAAFPADPLGGSTPTDKVLQQLLQRYPTQPAGTTSIVLVTDGAPNDLCSGRRAGAASPDVRPLVVAAARSLQSRGITTYALSLAGDDQELVQHLTEVNAAGGTGRPLITPSNMSELADGLRMLIGSDASCHVRLAQPVKLAQGCKGRVTLGDTPLVCDGADGYSLHDASTVRLNGDACARYHSQPSPSLSVDYPCDALAMH